MPRLSASHMHIYTANAHGIQKNERVRERPCCHPLPLNPRAQQPRLFNFLWSPNSLILESGGRATPRRCCQAKSIQLFSGVNFERQQKQSRMNAKTSTAFFETQAEKSATLSADRKYSFRGDYYMDVNKFLWV